MQSLAKLNCVTGQQKYPHCTQVAKENVASQFLYSVYISLRSVSLLGVVMMGQDGESRFSSTWLFNLTSPFSRGSVSQIASLFFLPPSPNTKGRDTAVRSSPQNSPRPPHPPSKAGEVSWPCLAWHKVTSLPSGQKLCEPSIFTYLRDSWNYSLSFPSFLRLSPSPCLSHSLWLTLFSFSFSSLQSLAFALIVLQPTATQFQFHC